ncbi:3-hydroxyacyl-CoA dehydrogenase/enoyl-CoA hydratase family protein [Amorphus sp. 3PC139-8]|uniref:3-hydroxyacyl-CoA dehydrogenase/enoyl-CoA hydratase family protein n=1 Tax=Amorphus sp. 3PC139-8 TaxID=2735676 RepID=UPI00345CDAE8
MTALGAERTGVARAAVIGAGSMGSGIAAQFANAGIPVDLLDIPGGEGKRNAPAESGVARQLKAGGFMASGGPKLVRTGNVEDDLGWLAEADWIVEAIIEDLDLKRDLYKRIETVRRPGTILSSNTSTIPRAALIADMGDGFAADFVITHFFNPPRVMQLMELVTAPETDPGVANRVRAAAKAALGKTVVDCRDTPGFIANRIGCFWMAVAALEAKRLGLSVERADAINAAFGIPRTGIFGLFDLVGIDLVPHVWGSLLSALPKQDDLHRFDLPADPLFSELVASGRYGRKSGAGFYRKAGDGSREALDLETGDYRPAEPVAAADLPGGGRDLAALLADDGAAGRYAASMLATVVAYAAEHAPELAADVGAVDIAIELGYSWRAGPFKLADRVGPATVVASLETMGRPVPALLAKAAADGGFYAADQVRAADGRMTVRQRPASLSEAREIVGNDAASLRDIGDGVACFEVHSKMNTLAPAVFDLLEDTLARAGRDFDALVIGNDDPRTFSAGADLSFILSLLESGEDATLEGYLRRGHDVFHRVLQAPVPVVTAAHGLALGGACEIALHTQGVVAHAELTIGLPETKAGLIPAWGGCTRLLARAPGRSGPKGPMAAAAQCFEVILPGRVSRSAAEAQEIGYLAETDGIVMHRELLLPEAKARAIALRDAGHRPPGPVFVTVAGPSGAKGLMSTVTAAHAAGRMTDTDFMLAEALASVLTGGPDGDPSRPMADRELMDLERETLLVLLQEPAVRGRIDHMLKTGKPLRN